MTRRSKLHTWSPLLALSLVLVMATAAHAQYRSGDGGSGTTASLQINFGTPPHWKSIPGTGVRVIRDDQRPDYDMFRYGGSYYVYRNDRWYSSRRGRGEFRMIDDRAVPRQISRVPRDRWHQYPSGWEGDNNPSRVHDQRRGPSGDQGQPKMGNRDHR